MPVIRSDDEEVGVIGWRLQGNQIRPGNAGAIDSGVNIGSFTDGNAENIRPQKGALALRRNSQDDSFVVGKDERASYTCSAAGDRRIDVTFWQAPQGIPGCIGRLGQYRHCDEESRTAYSSRVPALITPSTWSSGGLADDKASAEPVFAALQFGIGQHGPESFKGGLADFAAGDGDGCESGLSIFGKQNIVKADDREILRHAQTAVIGAMENANGCQIVARHNGGGRVGFQEFRAGEVGAFDGEIGVDHAAWVEAEAHDVIDEGLFPAVNGHELGRAADITDAGMPQAGEMLDGLRDPVFVIENDVANRVRDLPQIEIDCGHTAIGKEIDNRGFDLRREDGNAWHLQAEQAAHGMKCTLGVIVGVQHDGVHIMRQGLILKRGGDFGKNGLRTSETIRPSSERCRAPGYGQLGFASSQGREQRREPARGCADGWRAYRSGRGKR